MDNIILTQTTKESLIQDIVLEVLTGIEDLLLKDKQKPYSQKELLSIKEVSELFNITKATVHEWAKKGILRPNKIGHRTLFKTTEVLNAMTEKTALKRL